MDTESDKLSGMCEKHGNFLPCSKCAEEKDLGEKVQNDDSETVSSRSMVEEEDKLVNSSDEAESSKENETEINKEKIIELASVLSHFASVMNDRYARHLTPLLPEGAAAAINNAAEELGTLATQDSTASAAELARKIEGVTLVVNERVAVSRDAREDEQNLVAVIQDCGKIDKKITEIAGDQSDLALSVALSNMANAFNSLNRQARAKHEAIRRYQGR